MVRREERRDVGLDALRVFAIFEVVMLHLQSRRVPLPDWTHALFSQGRMGVDIFFVLSGFLLGSWLLQRIRSEPEGRLTLPSIRRFLRRRYFKTLPLYFIYVAVFASAGWLTFGPSYLTFTANYFDPYGCSYLWSLQVEEIFYLLLPLTLWLVTRASPRVVMPLIVVALLFSPVMRFLAPPSSTPAEYLKNLYWLTHTRLDGLVLGTLLSAARLWNLPVWQQLRRHRMLCFVAGAGIIAFLQWSHARETMFRTRGVATVEYFALAVASALLVVSLYGHASQSWWARVLELLSKATYAIYLAHPIVLLALDRYGLQSASPTLNLAVPLLLTALLSWILYSIEKVIYSNQDRAVARASQGWSLVTQRWTNRKASEVALE
jgi:peptidoglycan/LPS O-acetylase OafA/YrhL